MSEDILSVHFDVAFTDGGEVGFNLKFVCLPSDLKKNVVAK